MTMQTPPVTDDDFAAEAKAAMEREVGVTGLPVERTLVGNRLFLKFQVGREAPLFTHALHRAQHSLSTANPFRGAMSLSLQEAGHFPGSIEASALLTLLTRSTREVSTDASTRGYTVPYIPFQRMEDHQLAQPASHIVRGRRGVGKSTLIRRAVELLQPTPTIYAVLDMQAYSGLTGDDLLREVLHDVCGHLADSTQRVAARLGTKLDPTALLGVVESISTNATVVNKLPVAIRRALATLTTTTKSHALVFLDDFHVVDHDSQPHLLHAVHGALKGANGWLKVAGLSSLMNTYSPSTREGLQVPGDAQFISLDLTLENPEAAEAHLRAILTGFLRAVGHSMSSAVIPEASFRRLVWATAGVPRDFLQMFARTIEHARRNRHATVTLSDVNMAIGEFGQQKLDDVLQDARNEADVLKSLLSALEKLCLDEKQVNGFLVRSEDSIERSLVHALSDLRMVHLINQSITPNRAAVRYEAYILDYSMFTGFRKRRGVHEMVPEESQFKAAELRALPRVNPGFLDSSLVASPSSGGGRTLAR
jgi:hypothetical protein